MSPTRTRQATTQELHIIEHQRDAFMDELDALIIKYSTTPDNLYYMMIIPGREHAMIASNLNPAQQEELMETLLGGSWTHVSSKRN